MRPLHMRRIAFVTLGAILAASAYPCYNLGNRHLAGSPPVNIVKEDAVIVWDAERNIEHFIRKAQFNHAGKDFGFLVPTPTVPTLSVASEDVFKLLTDVTKMPEPTLNRGFGSFGGGLGGGGNPSPPVRVTQSKEVGKYQAVSLEAANLEALQKWLKDNDYASSNELMQWLAPYVKNRWTITAFRIRREASEGETEMTPIRLSFRTPRPFYPYREPKAKGDVRRFRLYFIADRAATGHLTDGATENGWTSPAKKMEFPEAQRGELAQKLGLSEPQLPEQMKLTVFEEMTVVREPKDVVFRLEGETPKRTLFGFAFAAGLISLSFAALLRRR